MSWLWRSLAVLVLGAFTLTPSAAQANPLCTPVATGGTITVITEGGVQYCVHSFTSPGNSAFATPHNLNVEYLVVGGGGGGGGVANVYVGGAGGGGAGGMVEGVRSLSPGTFVVTVGNGGAGASCGASCTAGANGGNSVFDNVIAVGGGRGGYVGVSSGAAGGSGGGGRLTVDGHGGAGTLGQGNSGGSGAGDAFAGTLGGAGGGGAGAPAQSVVDDRGTDGGSGLQSSITGTPTFYAGGGGGGGYSDQAPSVGAQGGQGGGGNAPLGRAAGLPGAANTGGGGGGAGGSLEGPARNGGNGGSGIVVIRYVLPDPPEADAGSDQAVPSGASVSLNGTQSTPVGQITYNWVQTAGPLVSLSNANTATPSFTAPSSTQSSVTLTFQLTVAYFGMTDTDTVNVVVTELQNPPPVGTGGAVREFNDTNGEVTWRAHAFFGNGTLNMPFATEIDLLIVGGGGGGAGNTAFSSAGGGGGGAGGLIFRQGEAISQGSFNVTVGAGGAGVNAQNVPASNGGNSVFNGLTALGGGGGILTAGNNNNSANSGGSGGGGRQNPAGTGLQPGSADGGFGTSGARNSNDLGGGGGGGAGTAPVNITGNDGGNGGGGQYYGNFFTNEFGASGWFAGGGGGGGNASGALGPGGTGGGGNGSSARDNIAPQPGAVNTGGGGGGGSSSHAGAPGGSGIVILRYIINTRPTANAGTNQEVIAGQQVTLNAGGSTDPDGPTPTGNIVSYAWVQTQGTTVTLSDPSAINPTFTLTQPANGEETLIFQLTVTDEFGLFHTDTVAITVQGLAELSASKTVMVFSEDGSLCDDFDASSPLEPEFPAAIPGACIEYLITVTNSGPVAATNVSLVDELPSNLTYIDHQLGGWGDDVEGDLECAAGSCILEITEGVIAAATSSGGGAATIRIRALLQ